MQINLKPLAERRIDASAIIRRLQATVADRRRHHALHAAGAGPDGRGSRQPHAVSVQPRASRSGAAHRRGRTGCSPTLRHAPGAAGRRHRSAERRPAGAWSSSIATRPRGSASPRRTIDDTLYSAFGQRQVSTIFTQLNQYHVILELQPRVSAEPGRACRHLRAHRRPDRQVPLTAMAQVTRYQRAAHDQPPGAVPVGDAVVQPRARRVAGRGRARRSKRDDAASGCRRASRRDSRGRRRRSRRRWRTKAG